MIDRIKAFAKHPLGWLFIAWLIGLLTVVLGFYETALYGFGHLGHWLQESFGNDIFVILAIAGVVTSLITGPVYLLWRRRDDT